MTITSKSIEDTNKLASLIAKSIKGGDVILLNGDLGAGKTTFVKAFCKCVGVKANVTSPTFTLLKTYKANNFNIVHVDAYRLEGDAFDELDDYFNEDNVIFIEWSSCLTSSLIKNALFIDIKYLSKNQRAFTLSAAGSHYESLLSEIIKNV